MKNFLKPNILPWFTMGAGGLGLVLQGWYKAGIDAKGLLPVSHPAMALSLCLTALVLAVLCFAVRTLNPVAKYSRLFPASAARAVGCLAAAVGILLSGIGYLKNGGGLGIATLVSGIAAAVAMVFLAFLRLKGGRPSVVLHALLTVFFMLFTVNNCRLWGAEPQTAEYLFPLFACVFLMLSGYRMTELDVQKGSRRWLVFSNQAALFFCCLSLSGTNRLFYLSMIVYLALDLCSVRTGRPAEEA